MTIAKLIAQAQERIRYWATRTGATARRWLQYWSDKLMILKGVVSPDTNPPVSVAAPPSDVTGLVANVVSQQVILTWNVSTAAVGHSIAYYRVQRKKSTDSVWGDPTVGYIPS